MPTSPDAPASPLGFLSFTLHAHLPYVVNHGTWPHGLEWLHEAVAETYLPLLRVLTRLEHDGIPLRLNLNLSPILLEQLSHPVFLAEFPQYLSRKLVAAREDEAFFAQSGEPHYAETARFWHSFFTETLDHFHALDGNLIAAFRGFHQRGQIEIITCAATHGYLPLLGTDASVRAQVRTGVAAHIRHFGFAPRGIWSPECGYRPAGLWQQPVPNVDGSPTPVPANCIGTEQALAESNLRFTFVDTHLVEESEAVSSPYSFPLNSAARIAHKPSETPSEPDHDPLALYRPYLVDGPSVHATPPLPAVAVFPRDPRTGLQVWSGDTGYPGDGNYVDFHKKRWPGGHRYWRVTGPHVDQGDKQPYFPHEAAAKVQDHASHFVHIVFTALTEARANNPEAPPILTAPFDAELFGHWWFEGPLWLEAVARTLHQYPIGIELSTAPAFLEFLEKARYPQAPFLALPEGSWGAEGTNAVWLNPETSWTWTHIYPAEHFVRDLCTEGRWRDSALGTAITQQLCRELLLLESSDWQFLITTGAARDYAEHRFHTHNNQFLELKTILQSFLAEGSLDEQQQSRLQEIQNRDSIFPDLDPAHWST